MSTVIDFLERMGQDSSLHNVDRAGLASALLASQLDDNARAVVLSGDVSAMETLVGAKKHVCSMVYPVDGVS
jgi:hypothetical protein